MIQAILNRIFNKTDILVNGDPEAPIYLRRWFIWPRKPKDLAMVARTYLHRFYTGDNVRDLHDHPWAFKSIILWGGYWEHRFNPAWLKWTENKKRWMAMDRNPKDGKYEAAYIGMHGHEPEKSLKTWYGPGSFLRRGASWTHAVELAKDKNGKDIPCWSLVRTGLKSRSWGFHTDGGWCHWKNYHSGACVCYDKPNEVYYS